MSTGISASCISWSCCSATCSVFCLFSAPGSSSASGVLDRLLVGPTSESGDITGVWTEFENICARVEKGAAGVSETEGAAAFADEGTAVLFAEGGIEIERGLLTGVAGIGECTGSALTCAGVVDDGVGVRAGVAPDDAGFEGTAPSLLGESSAFSILMFVVGVGPALGLLIVG